ncbi:MAG: hypothetical protein HYV93_00215 [Candidatus Rokubacteria bacterium]|nr:hypothetical protein [Candidatus Rokubacteria bacterium]
MDRDLVMRVSRATLGAAVPAAAGGALLAGLPGALGVLGGALVSVASFRWLARAASQPTTLIGGGRPRPLRVLALGLRHLVLFGVIVALLQAGLHPVGVMVGLAVLPPTVIALGWQGARTAL